MKATPTWRIMRAADAAAVARSEAAWTDGYRARYKASPHDPAEAKRLYEKSLEQWRKVEHADASLQRIVRRALKAAQRTEPTP